MKKNQVVFILLLVPFFAMGKVFAQATNEEVIDFAKIVPGMTVCEVGAGSGRYVFKLADLVGPSGKVFANDIEEKGKLDVIRAQAREKGYKNVETILGTESDPLLPKNTMDIVFMINAFHDFTKKTEMLASIAPSLKKGGKLIIADDKIDHKMLEAEPKGKHGANNDSKHPFLSLVEKSPFKIVMMKDTTIPPLDNGDRMLVYFLTLKSAK